MISYEKEKKRYEFKVEGKYFSIEEYPEKGNIATNSVKAEFDEIEKFYRLNVESQFETNRYIAFSFIKNGKKQEVQLELERINENAIDALRAFLSRHLSTIVQF